MGLRGSVLGGRWEGDGESRNEEDGSDEVLALGGMEGKLPGIEVVAGGLSSAYVISGRSGRLGESAAVVRGCLIILVVLRLSRLVGGLGELGDG